MAKTIFLYGLPCSGKTTIAKYIYEKYKNKVRLVHLDGDDIRKRLNNDLGFSEEDRQKNIERIANVCQLLNEMGINVICSFVAPTIKIRQRLKDIVKNITIINIYTPLEICMKRDVKGMYAKALTGEIKNFTGLDGVMEIDNDDPVVIGYKQKISDSAKDVLKIAPLEDKKRFFYENVIKTFLYRIWASIVIGSIIFFTTKSIPLTVTAFFYRFYF